MIDLAIASQRLSNQLITRPAFKQPEDAVRWLGAVQAQDYLGALWAVGLRVPHTTEADLERAIVDGLIVRTHPMRGTWHLVAADDIRWLLALMAPRNLASNAYWYRQFELDEATLARSNDLLTQALQGGKQLTRRELAATLEEAGIATGGLRLTFLLNRAEIDGVIASGARRGKQFTFALLDELVPVSKMLARDEALAELTRRYFTSHGPATIQDFAWWSGLLAADAKTGLQMVGSDVEEEIIDGQSYWFSPTNPHADATHPSAFLLPAYDEYTVAYKDRGAVLDPEYAARTGNGIFNPTIVVNGQIVGTWKRAFKQETVLINTDLFSSLGELETLALAKTAADYSRFLGKSLAPVSRESLNG